MRSPVVSMPVATVAVPEGAQAGSSQRTPRSRGRREGRMARRGEVSGRGRNHLGVGRSGPRCARLHRRRITRSGATSYLPHAAPQPSPKAPVMAYTPQHPVRFVTAASLFDGHDAAINITRRILQGHGAEAVPLGHDRSVRVIAETAIADDAQGIAVSGYQGARVEFFKYVLALLREKGAGHIRVFG